MPIPLILAGLLVLLTPALSAANTAQSSDVAARSRVASRAMGEGRFDEAAAIYRELLRALPNDAGLLMNLGMALAMGGQEAQAVEPLERAIALKPDLAPAHLFLGSSYVALGESQKAVAPLQRAAKMRPSDPEPPRLLASAYAAMGRHVDAAAQLRRATELAPKLPGTWFALGHAYNEVAQQAMATFGEREDEGAWRDLLVADALMADGRLNAAFAMYRDVLEKLPHMVTIHESIGRIYQQTGHSDWAARERARGPLSAAGCATRKAMCEFRAGRHRGALTAALSANDSESRYWRVRAATELARAAFKRLDALPDSRERREVRATQAIAERRYADALTELKAALKFAPRDPALVEQMGSAYYFARDYERAIETLSPIVERDPKNLQALVFLGDSLLQLQRPDEALPLLRRAVDLTPADPAPRLALGRAHLQKGEFAAAISLMEPQLAGDEDGSLHVQLARAYSGLGQREKADALLKRSQELQRGAQERAAGGGGAITPPKGSTPNSQIPTPK
jgi:tetratricopeptide (TPR) repeat protein